MFPTIKRIQKTFIRGENSWTLSKGLIEGLQVQKRNGGKNNSRLREYFIVITEVMIKQNIFRKLQKIQN